MVTNISMVRKDALWNLQKALMKKITTGVLKQVPVICSGEPYSLKTIPGMLLGSGRNGAPGHESSNDHVARGALYKINHVWLKES